MPGRKAITVWQNTRAATLLGSATRSTNAVGYGGRVPANTGGPQPREARCPLKSEEPPWHGSAAAPAGSPDPFWILHSSCKYYLIFATCCTATTHRKTLLYKGSPGPTRFLCPECW